MNGTRKGWKAQSQSSWSHAAKDSNQDPWFIARHSLEKETQSRCALLKTVSKSCATRQIVATAIAALFNLYEWRCPPKNCVVHEELKRTLGPRCPYFWLSGPGKTLCCTENLRRAKRVFSYPLCLRLPACHSFQLCDTSRSHRRKNQQGLLSVWTSCRLFMSTHRCRRFAFGMLPWSPLWKRTVRVYKLLYHSTLSR